MVKKTVIAIFILLIIAVILGVSTGVLTTARFSRLHNITREILNSHYLNWYESRAQDEIANGNKFAKERLEKKYHVFVNGILVDIGYDWDGSLYVPIRTIGESLNWVVNWIPELGVIQLVKGEEEANVDIVNFFGKAYVDLYRLVNLLRLQEVNVHGGNIEIYDNYKGLNSLSFNKLNRYSFYLDGMKMTDRAVLYEEQKYVPAKIFALCHGRIFRYDAVKGLAYIDNKQVKAIFVDGEAYSTLDNLQSVIDTGTEPFEFKKFQPDNSELPPAVFEGPGEKVVALTFDDYLGDKVYPLLEVLDRNNVKATFFIIGNSVENNSQLVKAIVQQGHEIANHTWDHFNIHTLSDDEIRAQLISTQLVLQRYGGTKATSFRPPGGYYDSKIIRMAWEVGLYTVLWSINSTDADSENGPAVIKNTIIKGIHPGAIVVMHMNRESTIEALTGTIKALRSKGYNFVTVSEILSDGEEMTNVR